MKLLRTCIGAAYALAMVMQPAIAAPTVPAETPQQLQTVQIPFDPPLDAALRYRWEKTVQKDGETDMAWSVSDFLFEEAENGYRLTVTPVSSGSNETDPAKLAFLKRLEDLTRRPFVLRLDENGSIEELEDADFYWSTIFRVMREELGKNDGKPLDEKGKQLLEDVIRTFEGIPAENRLALLTEEVQPMLEFGNVEIDSGEPIAATVETPSPFGGVLNRDLTISLKGVERGIASLSLRSSISREELAKLMQGMLAKFETLPEEKRAEAMEAVAAFKNFRHETAADYDVSVEDGVLTRFRSVETVEVSDKSGSTRKVTTQTLDLIE